eukprot:7815411-Lingulodinium_polyedra.AAC.1
MNENGAIKLTTDFEGQASALPAFCHGCSVLRAREPCARGAIAANTPCNRLRRAGARNPPRRRPVPGFAR